MILEAIQKRRSYRTYQNKDVAPEAIGEIIKAAQFAPTGMGKSAIEFVVVKDATIKEAIFNIVDQDYIKTASVLIIPVATADAALPVHELSIASAFMFLQATELGLGTVWKHLLPEWAEKLKELLNIPATSQLVNIIPVGYSAEEKPMHSDEEFSVAKIHTEKW